MAEVHDLVDRYLAAWNENDPDRISNVIGFLDKARLQAA
jgi:hypothetical protein